MNEKVYLGDSVYAEFDGHHITLTTDNGMGPSNVIHLDPMVQVGLVEFIEQIVKGGPNELDRA